MAFDGLAYLSEHDPAARYEVYQLSGGVINATFRATKLSGQPDAGRYAGHDSIILKHAPPYLAAIGPSVPFDVRRQTVEAAALRVIDIARRSSMKASQPRKAIEHSGVAIPQFLQHDEHNDVLLMSDLTNKPNLSEVFADLGGSVPAEVIRPSTAALLPRTDRSKAYFEAVGRCLGSFFGVLHSPALCEEVRFTLKTNELSLDNANAKTFVSTHAIEPIKDHIKRVPDMLQPEEARMLYDAVYEDFWRTNSPDEISFILGDCWSGAILVAMPSDESTSVTDSPQTAESINIPADPQPGVIDWEFASFGRGIHGDIAQLIAHLELLYISASQPEMLSAHNGSHKRAIESLLSSFISAYRIQTHRSSVHSLTSSSTILRSALLSTGAEILNCAFWKKWNCLSTTCPCAQVDSHGKAEEAHRCELVRKMLVHGIAYLRMGVGVICGRDVDSVRRSGELTKAVVERTRSASGQHEDPKFWLLDLFDL